MSDLMAPWRSLGALPLAELVEPRLRLHHAAQLAACVGQSLLPKRSDDGQMALSFLDGGMFGEALPQGFRVGLRLSSGSLEIEHSEDGLLGNLSLAGHTRTEALAWLRDRLTELGVSAEGLSISMPYELPPHPLADGAAFSEGASEALGELARWYANAAALLAPLAEQEDATTLRCWPHHFDLAVLLSLDAEAELGVDAEADSDPARTIGVGLSPGDASYAEPYFYVTPWPNPKGVDYPALPFGHWYTHSWVGAVLSATELLNEPTNTQQARVEAFLAAAVGACEELLA